MILADLGYGAIWLTLAAALWAATAASMGTWRRRPELLASARNALLATAGLTTLSCALLLALLYARNFQVQYVYEHVSTYLRPAYVLAAFWAGLEGSQLLWLWLLAIFTGVAVLRRPTWDRELRPYAMVFLAFAQAFFALLLVAISNPFQLMPDAPAEGISLNPLLQNFWMIVHPPIIFASYALWTIPAAYALAALVRGKLDATWLRGTRMWSVAAWATLGVGILVGGWWAYLELGWGGYWAWDPVENSSLIPFLVGTAFIHSAVVQERRDMFRTWNVGLATLTFVLTVFATFVTRSGLIESVHAFAESPIGYYYLGYMLLVLAIAVGLMLARYRELRGAGELGELLSREFVFLIVNLLFLGLAGAVMLGTLWPTLTESVRGAATSLTKESYNRFAGPLGLLLLALLGLCPLVDWRKTTSRQLLGSLWVQAAMALVTGVLLALLGDWPPAAVLAFAIVAFVATTILLQMVQSVVARARTADENPLVAAARVLGRSRRRYGAHIIHLAIVLIVMGITASQAHQVEVQVPLAKGATIDVEGYTLAYRSFDYQSSELAGNKLRNEVILDVYRGDRLVDTLSPERNFHSNVDGSVTEVALRSTLKEDLYIVLASLEPDGMAALQVLVTPLVLWLWIGGLILILGTLLALWPSRSGRPARNPEGEVA
ncbi:MAG TPA: cytochrome c-type biogenesis CcmF C-terminal domain-containing protein [Anaerolineae bacterium]|nr:cytochrome c-type biogenesis CcmF C-terminal domain-containing protein [Anaerolineae bacterium]